LRKRGYDIEINRKTVDDVGAAVVAYEDERYGFVARNDAA
jgi:hypothetical protein